MSLLKVNENDTLDINADILRYLEEEEDEEHKINQFMIGIRYLFEGFAVKVSNRANFRLDEHAHLSKTLVRH